MIPEHAAIDKDIIRSHSTKEPLFVDQIQSVLGSERIQQMAARVGIAPDALSGQLANLLPQVIDKVTPDGNVPSESNVQQGLGGLLQRFLGGR